MPCAGFPHVAWPGSRRPDFPASHRQIHWQLAGLRSDVPGTNSLLERHGGRATEGLSARIVQRLLALAVCVWPNWAAGAPVRRSLIQYDH
jgi:hypothetical protein